MCVYLPCSDVQEATRGVIELDLKSLGLIGCSDQVHDLALGLAYGTHLSNKRSVAANNEGQSIQQGWSVNDHPTPTYPTPTYRSYTVTVT